MSIRILGGEMTADRGTVSLRKGLRVAMLPEGYDIDTIDDLYRLVAELGNLPPTVALHTRIFMVQNPDILVAVA